MDNKLLLIILDGFGIGPKNEHNAIFRAQTPFFDSLLENFPHTALQAAGAAVGVLPGQIGSSEVGHLTIGAGRAVDQDITRIHNAIKIGEFFNNPVFNLAIEHTLKHSSTLHLAGLLSYGGVHSHQEHLYALIGLAAKKGVKRVSIHAFTDGRDSPPASGARYLAELQQYLAKTGSPARIATLMGRFFAMDRDQHWNRTQAAFKAMVKSKGYRFSDPQATLTNFYAQGKFDEFIEPCVFESGHKLHAVGKNDAIIFFNFRADRMRQLTKLFLEVKNELNLAMVSITGYGDALQGAQMAYPDEVVKKHFSEVLSILNMRQIKLAETEKYAHLTYFFNGGQEIAYPKEERVMVPSPRVENFAKTPQMSAPEITLQTVAQLNRGEFPFVAVNFCNADMLGHTGDIHAAVQGIEYLDRCLFKVVSEARRKGYQTIITADHGNAEEMYNIELDHTHTAHTVNQVPFLIITDKTVRLTKDGTLGNVAPTALQLLGLERPEEMKNKSLILE